jgi:hypothetical protein
MKVHKLRRFRFKHEWGWQTYAMETWCPIGFTSDDTRAVDGWIGVTCKRCLKLKKAKFFQAKDAKGASHG